MNFFQVQFDAKIDSNYNMVIFSYNTFGEYFNKILKLIYGISHKCKIS